MKNLFFPSLLPKGELTSISTSPFTKQSLIFTTKRKIPSENTVGKGKNAGNQHFLLFPQCFLLFKNVRFSIFESCFILLSANAFNLDKCKI